MPDERPILPARMVNEFVYCPRLFYYEFVEGLFVHNADTLAGKAVHQRVDAKAQSLPVAKDEGGRRKAGGIDKEASSDSSQISGPEAQNSDSKSQISDLKSQIPPEEIHARSVSLYSERLGVTAKLDLVEGRLDPTELFSTPVVSPVEYKKGAPREGDDGPEIWPADRIQLALQILLLRENGYRSDEGLLYYRETRQRVPFTLDTETEAWVEDTLKEARAAVAGPIPPPLDDSPKCPRCSLVGICLPDETRGLAEAVGGTAQPSRQLALAIEETPAEDYDATRLNWGPFAQLPEIRLHPPVLAGDVRRLIAPNAETKALYLNTPGHFVGKKGGELVVKEKGKQVASMRLHELHHVALFGPVQISTGVVHTLCEKDIAITYFSMGGWFYGMTRGHGLKNVFTRIEQFRHAADPNLALLPARLFVYGKIRNQRTLLMRNHLEPPREALKLLKYLAGAALHTPNIPFLLGIEGAAAHVYFGLFRGLLKGAPTEDAHRPDAEKLWPFFTGERNRRPPRDPVNALLSLIYSLLAKECTLAAYAVGFDPYVGFLHQPRFGRPALALDLMEEFRPLVADSTVISLINNRMLEENDFIRAGEAVSLDTAARKKVFVAYERRLADTVTHPVFGYKVSYRRAIELQARLLAKTLTGEIEQYVPFTTR